jgi:murein endopeptidase
MAEEKEKVTSGISETPTLDIRRYEDGSYIMNYAAEDPIASRERIQEADLDGEIKRLFGYSTWDEYKKDNWKDLTRKVKRSAKTGKVVAAPTVHPFHVAYAYEEFTNNFNPNDYEIVGIPHGAQESGEKNDRVALKEFFDWGPTDEEKGAAAAQKIIDRVLKKNVSDQEKIDQLKAERDSVLLRKKQFPLDYVYGFNVTINIKITELQGGDADIEAGTRKQAAKAAMEKEKQRKAGQKLGRASAPSAGGRVMGSDVETDWFGVPTLSGEDQMFSLWKDEPPRWVNRQDLKKRIKDNPLEGSLAEIWRDMGYSEDIIDASMEPMTNIWMILSIFDMTGIMSYPYAYAAYKEFEENPDAINTALMVLSFIACIPVVGPGMAGFGTKVAREVSSKEIADVAVKVTKQLNALGKATSATPLVGHHRAIMDIVRITEDAVEAARKVPHVKNAGRWGGKSQDITKIAKDLERQNRIATGVKKSHKEFIDAAKVLANKRISQNAAAAADKLDDAILKIDDLITRTKNLPSHGGVSAAERYSEMLSIAGKQSKEMRKYAEAFRKSALIDPFSKEAIIIKKLWGTAHGKVYLTSILGAVGHAGLGIATDRPIDKTLSKYLSDLQGGKDPGPGTYTDEEIEKMEQDALNKTREELEKTLTRERTIYAPKVFALRDRFLRDGGILEQAMRNPEEQLANKNIIDRIKNKFDIKKLFNDKITDLHVRHPSGQYWKSNYKTEQDTTSSREGALKLSNINEVNNLSLLSEIRALKLQYYILPRGWRNGEWITRKEKLFARRIGANVGLSAGPAPRLPPEMAAIVSPGAIKTNVAKSNVLVWGHSQASQYGQGGAIMSQIKVAGGRVGHHKAITGFSDGPGGRFSNKRLDMEIVKVPKLEYTHAFLFLNGNTGVKGPLYKKNKKTIIDHVTGPLGISKENIVVVLPPINLDKSDYDRRPINNLAREYFNSLGIAVAPEVIGRAGDFSDDGVHLKGKSELAKETSTTLLGDVFAKNVETAELPKEGTPLESITRQQVASIVANEARKAGLDPAASLAIAYAESNMNHMAVNANTGASGVFQFMPKWKDTWKGYGMKWEQRFNPTIQAKTYAKIIKKKINRLRTKGYIENSSAAKIDPRELPIVYLSWQQGDGGVSQLMDALKSGRPVSAAQARRMKANYPKEATGDYSNPRDFLDAWIKRFEKKYRRGQSFLSGQTAPLATAAEPRPTEDISPIVNEDLGLRKFTGAGGVQAASPEKAYAQLSSIRFLNDLSKVGDGKWTIGDMTSEGGGKIMAHASHQTGLDVDVAIPYIDGTTSIFTQSDDPEKFEQSLQRRRGRDRDRVANKKWEYENYSPDRKELDVDKIFGMLAMAKEHGATLILTDNSIIEKLKQAARDKIGIAESIGDQSAEELLSLVKMLKHYRAHKDHFHIRLPLDKSLCKGEGSCNQMYLKYWNTPEKLLSYVRNNNINLADIKSTPVANIKKASKPVSFKRRRKGSAKYSYIIGDLYGNTIYDNYNENTVIAHGASMNKPILALVQLLKYRNEPDKKLNKKELDGLLAYTGHESNNVNRLISGRDPLTKSLRARRRTIGKITKEDARKYLKMLGLDPGMQIRYGDNAQTAKHFFDFMKLVHNKERIASLGIEEEASIILNYMQRNVPGVSMKDRESKKWLVFAEDMRKRGIPVNSVYGKGGLIKNGLHYSFVINEKYLLSIYSDQGSKFPGARRRLYDVIEEVLAKVLGRSLQENSKYMKIVFDLIDEVKNIGMV